MVGWLMKESWIVTVLFPGTLHGLDKAVDIRIPKCVRGSRSVCDPGTSTLGQDI